MNRNLMAKAIVSIIDKLLKKTTMIIYLKNKHITTISLFTIAYIIFLVYVCNGERTESSYFTIKKYPNNWIRF